MLDLYLRELERELVRKLPADDVQGLLNEAKDHLEQSIQARLELGATRAEAECEALASFGRRGALVERLPDPPQGRLALRLGGLATATLGIMASTLLFMLMDWTWLGLLPLLTVGLLATWSLAFGFRSRRAVPVPIFLGGFAASLAFTVMMGATTLNLSHYGGSTGVLRWNARENVATSLSRPAQTWTTRDTQGRTVIYRNPSPFSDSDLAAIPHAEADPIGNALSQAGSALSSGMLLGSVAGLFDLIGAGLGWLWHRRRPRRTTVA